MTIRQSKQRKLLSLSLTLKKVTPKYLVVYEN